MTEDAQVTERDERAARRLFKLNALGLSMTARFVPQSLSRNRDEKDERGRRVPSLNWLVTITRDEPARSHRGEYSGIEYMQGIGHVPGYPQGWGRMTMHEVERRDAFESAAELGTYPRNPKGESWIMQNQRVTLPAPKLEDVLHSLLSDGEAAEYTFEDWASNFGYDTDSRKAEATYRACVDVGIRLRKLLGGDDVIVTELRELFRDY